MAVSAGDWSTHQLAEFVAFVTAFADEEAALAGAAERVAEALEGEVGAAVVNGRLRASVGFPRGGAPADDLVALCADAPQAPVELPGLGHGYATVARVDDAGRAWLLVARAGDEAFAVREVNLLRAMARVLGQTLRMLRALADERALRERHERESHERAELVSLLTERQRLLERLGRIQRSLSHGAPLPEVLDAITYGAHDLLGDELCGLRLVDPDDPGQLLLASQYGLSPSEAESARRAPIGQGAGGRAISENRLVIIEDYAHEPDAMPVFRSFGTTTAMAAPVHENGQVVGSLVVASCRKGRRYSILEQEALTSLAQHASLALTDAKNVEAMREAQRAKDMFLAMVSHELKTPLTVIMGALRTIEHHGGLDPRLVAELTATAYARAEELRRLIDRLLRGARAELAGACKDAALRALVEQAVDGFPQLHRLAVDVPDDVDLRIDTAAFADVVGILVENAVAHSPAEAAIDVVARVAGSEVRVSVTNPGTLPRDVEPASLFLPFQRGADARSSGVGLGLYIAARLADALGGGIEAESDDGRVTFTLRVPYAGPPAVLLGATA